MTKKEAVMKFIRDYTSILNSVFITLVFTGLKLYGIIDWSWFWVLSPIWITAIQMLCIIAVTGIAFLVLGLVYNIFGEKEK